jgi:hypothetical protein
MSKKGPSRKKIIEQEYQQKISPPKLDYFQTKELETENNDDDELYGLNTEIKNIKENAFKIDPKLKTKSKVIIKEPEKMVIEWNCVKNDQLNFDLIEKVY